MGQYITVATGFRPCLSRIIEGYLTNPPQLPFLLELEEKTKTIRQEVDVSWFYPHCQQFGHYFACAYSIDTATEKRSRTVIVAGSGWTISRIYHSEEGQGDFWSIL